MAQSTEQSGENQVMPLAGARNGSKDASVVLVLPRVGQIVAEALLHGHEQHARHFTPPRLSSAHTMASRIAQLFRTKSLDELVAETQEEGHQLKKALGPWNLVALGIGAIIGAGIFATIGTAAAGDASRPGAGPALMLSFVLTAIVCGFTALCYAEFASMVPVAGSAYTYSYATLGELVAWIIGWDLLIEYAIGNVAVAISWANYMNTFLEGTPLHLPAWLTVDYHTATATLPMAY